MTTIVMRAVSSFSGSIYGGRSHAEADALREYNMSRFMDKAAVCEREEHYEEAIRYLRAVLEEDRNRERHIDVRFRIARLYHKKLDLPLKAVKEYKMILNGAPEDNPFRRDAQESIRELSRVPAVG